MTKTFGAKFVGREHTWNYLDDDGQEATHPFREAAAITFDQQAEYQRHSLGQTTDAYFARNAMNKKLREIDALEVEDDEKVRLISEFNAAEIAGDKEKFKRLVEQTLLLIAPGDQKDMKKLLTKALPADVTGLRDYLRGRVIDRVKDEVEDEAHVDPTLPPAPSEQPATGE